MAHIGFDIDGVLADFTNAFLPWYNDRYGTSFVVEDFWTHEFYRVFGVSREALNADIRLLVQSPSSQDIRPYHDMPAIIGRLATRHILSMVTARFTPDALLRSRSFGDLHYPGCFSALHISYHPDENPHGHKGQLCKKEGIAVLVEDQANYVHDALAHGIQAIMINRPWNIHASVPAEVPRIDVRDLETTLATLLNGSS